MAAVPGTRLPKGQIRGSDPRIRPGSPVLEPPKTARPTDGPECPASPSPVRGPYGPLRIHRQARGFTYGLGQVREGCSAGHAWGGTSLPAAPEGAAYFNYTPIRHTPHQVSRSGSGTGSGATHPDQAPGSDNGIRHRGWKYPHARPAPWSSLQIPSEHRYPSRRSASPSGSHPRARGRFPAACPSRS
jgi:hypothetical protein